MQEFRYFDDARQIQWVSGAPPLAEPLCGFHGQRCTYPVADWRFSLPVAAVVVLVLVGAAFAFKSVARAEEADGSAVALAVAGGRHQIQSKNYCFEREAHHWPYGGGPTLQYHGVLVQSAPSQRSGNAEAS